MNEVEMLARDVEAWLNTPEGRESMRQSLADGAAEVERLRRAMRVDPIRILDRVTI